MNAPAERDARRDGQATARLFLRAVLLSEHAILLAAGWYSLWAVKEWETQVALPRGIAGGMYAVAAGLSFLAALLLAAMLLRLRLPTWIVTLMSATLGPLAGGGALILFLRYG